jgi:hypothetical protein
MYDESQQHLHNSNKGELSPVCISVKKTEPQFDNLTSIMMMGGAGVGGGISNPHLSTSTNFNLNAQSHVPHDN